MGDLYSAAGFYQRVFTVVLTLALGESFKQFIYDKQEKSADTTIHWHRLPSLVTFVLLIVPFFQGMSLYLSAVYGSKTHAADGRELLTDAFVFTLDSAIFFAMSRMLSSAIWSRLFYFIIALLVVDASWIRIQAHNLPVIRIWFWQDLGMIGALLLALILLRKAPQRTKSDRPNIIPALIGTAITIAKTLTDYWTGWAIYFPGYQQ